MGLFIIGYYTYIEIFFFSLNHQQGNVNMWWCVYLIIFKETKKGKFLAFCDVMSVKNFIFRITYLLLILRILTNFCKILNIFSQKLVDWLVKFCGRFHHCRLFNAKSIFIHIVLLATVVEGDQKAPFSIATTQRCRGGRYSFPWVAPLYPTYIPYTAEC